MRLRKVAVVGGGPGGLYTARLLRLAQPDCVVEVHEQVGPEETFGFGVGLAAGTQANLRAADPESLAAIVERGHPHEMTLRVGARTARMASRDLRAIGRTALLQVLRAAATSAGASVVEDRVAADDLDADLVVAADGVSSATRTEHSDAFGARTSTGASWYLWCGTDTALPAALFMPVRTEHGTFVTHAYPYAPDRSTFLVETDQRTWRAAGFEATTHRLADGPGDASDENALRYLEEAFAEPLGGHRLIGNRTRWSRFRTVRCSRWSDGRVVLLGDAAHTAHYSIGSGTKLAMEDAIALVAALDGHDRLPAALTAYEAARRPAVEHLQAVAERSAQWWDSFAERLDLPVHRLLVAYMTRAGKVPLRRFAATTPAVVEAALVEYAGRPVTAASMGDVPEAVLDQGLVVDGATLDSRRADPPEPVHEVRFAGDPWSADATAALDDVVDAVGATGAASVRIGGPVDRDALLDRLAWAERLRWVVKGRPVVVAGSRGDEDDLAAGILAGRADLVALS